MITLEHTYWLMGVLTGGVAPQSGNNGEQSGGAVERCNHDAKLYLRLPSLVSTWNRVIFLSAPVALSNWA